MGIFYPESPEPVQLPERPKTQCDQVSISTLCGQDFTRRKYIPHPRGNIEIGSKCSHLAQLKSDISFENNLMSGYRLGSTFIVNYTYKPCMYTKSLKIPKGGNQNLYIQEEQTTQWPKDTKGAIRIHTMAKRKSTKG